MNRATASGIRLTETDAALVKGMLRRGDRQHDIAAWFGVNGARIAEIATGPRYANVPPARDELLPLPGPYMPGRIAHATVAGLQRVRDILERAARDCDEALGQIENSE
jgi:hypothetical protein